MRKANNKEYSDIQRKANKFVDKYIKNHYDEMMINAIKSGHSLI